MNRVWQRGHINCRVRKIITMEVEFVTALAQVEDDSLREKACLAAIAVVKGWTANASTKRKRDEVAENLARTIASQYDQGDSASLRPVYVSDSMGDTGLMDFCREGPDALLKDEDLAGEECECFDGSGRTTLSAADAKVGLLARCDGRLWQALDKAGGSLERRKAISGVPEFVVDLCSGYADSQQFVLIESTDRVVGPTVSHLAFAQIYVVLYGGFECIVWRPTLENLARVAKLYASPREHESRDPSSLLEGESFRYVVKAGDTLVIPPGHPHLIRHKQGGTVAFTLIFANPSSRTVFLNVVKDVEDDAVKKVYARHLFKHLAPASHYQGEETQMSPTQELVALEAPLVKKGRKVRFRARKRKVTQRLGASSSILFGDEDALNGGDCQSLEDDKDES